MATTVAESEGQRLGIAEIGRRQVSITCRQPLQKLAAAWISFCTFAKRLACSAGSVTASAFC